MIMHRKFRARNLIVNLIVNDKLKEFQNWIDNIVPVARKRSVIDRRSREHIADRIVVSFLEIKGEIIINICSKRCLSNYWSCRNFSGSSTFSSLTKLAYGPCRCRLLIQRFVHVFRLEALARRRRRRKSRMSSNNSCSSSSSESAILNIYFEKQRMRFKNNP